MKKCLFVFCISLLFASYLNAREVVKGGNMEDASAWNFYYNSADAKDTLGTIQFNYTADKPAAGHGGCYRVSTYGQSATFLWQKITLAPGHTYRWDGAFKNATNTATNTWLEFGLMKNQPTGGEITTGEFSYVFNLNTWMGKDTLNVDTTFGKYFPFSGANSNTFKLPETETDTEWFVVIKTGCWGDLGSQTTKFDFLFDDISILDLTPSVVKGGNMEDASAWNFYYNSADAKDTLGTIQFNYKADKPAAGDGGCYRVSTYGQSATFLWQPITLLPGHKYSWSGAFKNASPDATNTWLEYGIMKNQPKGGEITTGEFSYVYNLNTWMGKDTLKVDTTFDKYFPLSGGENGIISIPDTVSDSEWFIVIKTGCWGDLGSQTTKFDFLFDNIDVYDVSVVNVGGNMEDASAWKFYYNSVDAKDTLGIHEFNYTANTPAAGNGGCYRVKTYGQSATFTYQSVDVIPGHRYQLTGAFKNALDAAPSTWLEFGVMKNEPGGGEVTTGEFFFVYNLNTWMGKDTLNADTTFPEYFPSNIGANGTFLVPDTITDTQWWILIKNGCWGASVGDQATNFEFLYDEIYLVDLGLEPWITLPASNVVVGAVTDAVDYTGSVTMKYDAENVYLKLNVADDVLMGTGNVWDMDNIEIYFDLDNSKNVHWPRNGGWMASDPTFDTNDFQFRLVPGKDWSANNSIKDVIQVYTKTETGYNFDVTIPWKSLSADFIPTSGASIGFDILMSDNDDNFRNQLTWKSTTDKPFNDPSLWGTLQLTPSGSFIVVDDVEAPKEVSNVVATANGNKIVVTWDAATDNVAVMSYIIYNKATVIDTVYAAETGNTYTFSNLANGSYRPGIVAVDNFGNVSKKIQSVAAIDIKVSVENMVNTSFNVYPNPSTGLINIKTSGNGKNQLVIYNAAGQKVHSAEFIQKHTVDLKEVNKGIYFIQLKSDEKTETTKVVIK